ncbi:enoyl-CoA hydratase/isomerase family protein [Rouxiella badensis]|uniref:enoyl-CoA hydratase/isomerase family protein n=1 Tax=Rouxiella badensis TaxID=1646377 RepID=UPI001D14C9EF|nr:enoyl-CoA hydratase/isomerase family protein [Rouxiella badensis]MCC3720009.1 enoyl-CoA hydratase/isomerase family protein [Rouxiella badensis]MCC3729672.1 enoyl-CoA hydratase/isomerase family protein [Rouxiella badensis]MCC3738380.1 enoyl-CoA hydratase/isomerase family protein [Rouxiella badensis]
MSDLITETLNNAAKRVKSRLAELALTADTPSETQIERCNQDRQIQAFFEENALALYEHWTALYSRSLRVTDLFERTFSVLFAPQTTVSDVRVIADYCFSLFLQQVLQSEDHGTHLLHAQLEPKALSLSLMRPFAADGRLRLASLEMTREGEAAVITFLNGHNLNAEDGEFVDDLETAIDILCLSPDIKVGVLRGGEVTHPKYAGKRVFCSGINLKKLHSGEISYAGFLIGREMACLNKLIHGVTYPTPNLVSRAVKPWIAVVDTFAIGGGMQMVLACDYVIAEMGSYASLPAAKEGIIPGVSNLRLTAATTERFAKRVILHGEQIYAGAAYSDYIFDQVVTSQELDGALADAVELMAAPAVPANKRMISLSKEPLSAFRHYMASFCTEQVIRMYSRDVREKTGKFAQKAKLG